MIQGRTQDKRLGCYVGCEESPKKVTRTFGIFMGTVLNPDGSSGHGLLIETESTEQFLFQRTSHSRGTRA